MTRERRQPTRSHRRTALAAVAGLVFALLLLPGAAGGQAPGPAPEPLPGVDEVPPSAGLDLDPSFANSPQSRAAATLLAGTNATARIAFDPASGNATTLFAGGTPLSNARAGSTANVARAFLRDNADLFSLSAPAVDDLVETSSYTTGSGLRVTELTQFANGLEVFNSTAKVSLDPTGRVISVANSLRPGLNVVNPNPKLTGEEAGQAARLAFGQRQPFSELPGQSQLGFEDPTPKLYAFPIDTGLRPAWSAYVHEGFSTWLVLIDAESGSELFRHNLTAAEGPEGLVFDEYPVGPAPSGQVMQPFVGNLSALPTARNNWVGPSVLISDCPECTSGNNVAALADQDGDLAGALTVAGEVPPVFDFPFTNAYELSSPPDPDADSDAAATNLFYLNNVAHDWFYELGFTEAAGNFQSDNFGVNTSGDGDPVIALAQFGFDSCPSGFEPCRNNAYFETHPDGTAGRMYMFTFTAPFNAQRDASFDADVVFHEYGHGVSNRLIGNATGLTGYQGLAMGEGWSDYWAITRFDNPVVGEYVTGDPVSGIRSHSYENYPRTFGDLCDTSGGPCSTHAGGEIWAATLWDLRAAYRSILGAGPGTAAADQAIFDGIATTPNNPSMLHARDAIIAAEVASPSAVVTTCDLWSVFAAHGFGYSAGSSGLGPVTEAFDLAPSCLSLAFLQEPDGGAVNVPFPTQPVVAVQDHNGVTVTVDNGRPVTLAHDGPGGGTCDSTTVNTVNGVATFANCLLDTEGTHTLEAQSPDLTSVDTAPFEVVEAVVGPPAQLVFAQEPGTGTVHEPFPTQPVVDIQDSNGLTVTTDDSTVVTLALTGPGTLTCDGGLSSTATSGIAAFSGCAIDTLGTAYEIEATATSLTSATTSPFDIEPPPGGTWYLAEGFTGLGWNTELHILNPGADDAEVTVAYLLDTGSPALRSFTVDGQSQLTIDASDTDEGPGPDAAFGVRVTSDRPVMVEEDMYAGESGDFAHGTQATNTLSPTWFFAEGFTQFGWETFILVAVPGDTAADVTITYNVQGGAPVTDTINVAGQSRFTFAGHVDVPESTFSVDISSTEPLVAEMVMYDPGRLLAHRTIGVSEASTTWYLGEGFTGFGWETFISVGNPSTSQATVTATYNLDGEPPVEKELLVEAGSRGTFIAHGGDSGVGPGKAFGLVITSDQPVVVQEVLIDPFPGGSRAHSTMASPSLAAQWTFSGGSSLEGFVTFLTVANPTGSDAAVSATYYFNDGTAPAFENLNVLANSRGTLASTTIVPVGKQFGVILSATGANVVAQQVVYDEIRGRAFSSSGQLGP